MGYFAFFSYSRRDARTAKWLHRVLDRYRTPRSLISGKFGDKSIAAKLHPIFQDRTDMSGGGELSARIETALAESERLIVLCSPAAATSEWVNREVLAFLARGGQDRIFPVIADRLADSPDIENDFYPPALRGRGLLASDLRDLRAADGRTIGDGRQHGKLKLIAGLLSVPLDALIRRERRRQLTLSMALTTAMIVFAGLALFAFLEREASEARRIELVASQARDSIRRGDRSAARTLVADEQAESRLQATALGRWVLSQSALTHSATLPMTSSSTLLGCGSLGIIVQWSDGQAQTFRALREPGARFAADDRLVACFASEMRVVAFDTLGGVYLFESLDAPPVYTKPTAWMPHTFVQMTPDVVALESQFSGRFRYLISEGRLERLGAAGPMDDQRVGFLPSPDGVSGFTIRKSGLGRYILEKPTPDRTNELVEIWNTSLSLLSFRACLPGPDSWPLTCLLADGALIGLDWSGNVDRRYPDLGGVVRLTPAGPLNLIAFGSRNEIWSVPLDGSPPVELDHRMDGSIAFAGAISDTHAVAVDAQGSFCLFRIGGAACAFSELASAGSAAADAVSFAYTSSTGTLWSRDEAGSVIARNLSGLIMTPTAKSPNEPMSSEQAGDAPEIALIARAVFELDRFGVDTFLPAAPSTLGALSADLRWQIATPPDGGVVAISDLGIFTLREEGKLAQFEERAGRAWLRYEDGLDVFSLEQAGDALSVAQFRGSDLQATVLAVADDGQSALLTGELGSVLISNGRLIRLPTLNALKDPPRQIAFDASRGLVAFSDGSCGVKLFEVGYPEAHGDYVAACDRESAIIIGEEHIWMQSGDRWLRSPLPIPYRPAITASSPGMSP